MVYSSTWYTAYSIWYTVYSQVHSIKYMVYGKVSDGRGELALLHRVPDPIHLPPFTALIYCILYATYYMPCFMLYTIYHVLYTEYYILYTICYMPHCCISSETPFTCRVRQMPLEEKLSTKGNPSQIRCRAEIYSGMTRPQSTPQKTLTLLCCIASEIPFTCRRSLL